MRIHAVERIRVKSWQKKRQTQRVGQRAGDDEDYPRGEVSRTEMMTEVRVSRRSQLDGGEAGDVTSDAPMDVAIEMARPAIPGAKETAGATIAEPMERNQNGK